MAEGNITLEEVTKAILDAIRDRNLRLADQGAFYNPPEQPTIIELNTEALAPRSAMAIARHRERTAVLNNAQRQALPIIGYQPWHI